MAITLEGTWYRGYHTETAGTAITEAIPSYMDMVPRVDKICYEAGATEHTLTVMRPIATTKLVQGSQSGASTITVESTDPGRTTADAEETLAAADWLGWICENNMAHADSINSVSGQVITLDNALTTDVVAGQTIWCFYEVGRSTHVQVKLTASTRLEIEGPIQAGYDEHTGQASGRRDGFSDMLLIHVDNATNAGKLHWMSGRHVSASNIVTG